MLRNLFPVLPKLSSKKPFFYSWLFPSKRSRSVTVKEGFPLDQPSAGGGDRGANAVAMDLSGSVYVAGWAASILPDDMLSGTQDSFVTKYSDSGTRQWTRYLGFASEDTEARGIATDASNNIYITGYTSAGADGSDSTGGSDLFVAKYNSSGAMQWTRQLGTVSGKTWGSGLAVDSSGNVYVTGATTGDLQGNGLVGTEDVFIVKYDKGGNRQWIRQLGAPSGSAVGYGIALNASNHIYVTGSTDAGLDGNHLMGTGDLFLTKYSSSGIRQWTRQRGVAFAETWGRSLLSDDSENIYVAGTIRGGINGKSSTMPGDYFVAKYNGAGIRQWTRYFEANSPTDDHNVGIFSARGGVKL